ncbi:adipocyte plasma membrane-associated protein [Nannochloropsis oceanica]
MPPRTRSQTRGSSDITGTSAKSRAKGINGEEEGVEEEGLGLCPLVTPFYVLLAIAVAVGSGITHKILQGPFHPVTWQNPPELVVLYVNHDLEGAEHLFLNQVVGPESIAMGSNDELYLSLNDGRVVRTDSLYRHKTTVFFTGGVIKAERGGKGKEGGTLPNGESEKELMAWCSAEMDAMRFSESTEGKCGRPLGLRFINESNILYIADAYHGIFTLDAATLHVQHLVAPSAPSFLPPSSIPLHPGVQLPLRFSNDLDIVPGTGGDFFFSDSTWGWSRAEHAVDILDGAPRGRLFRYVALTREIEPVICGLHFANGVQCLGEVKEVGEKGWLPHFVLVVESTRFRILKVDMWAWAEEAGKEGREDALRNYCDEGCGFPPFVSVFAEGLPGLPDNIRLHRQVEGGREGGLVGMGVEENVLLLGMGAKNARPFALLQFLYQRPWLRLVLGALVPLKYFHTFMPKYGLGGILSLEGSVLRVLQDPSGRTPFVSELHIHPRTGDLLLGSFRNRFLSKVTLSALEH